MGNFQGFIKHSFSYSKAILLRFKKHTLSILKYYMLTIKLHRSYLSFYLAS